MGKIKPNDLPERWLDYKAVGSVIPGTRFAACKVPLKKVMLFKVSPKERFSAEDLMQAFPKVGLLVDLTNTTRYYDPEEFLNKNIKYEKICCPGHVIPPPSIVKKFHEMVTSFLESDKDPDSLIVVHCTHGVNRTGYFICSYMIQHMNFEPEEAMKLFNNARGHDMERENYTEDLKNGCNGGSEKHLDKGYMNKLFMIKKREERKLKRENGSASDDWRRDAREFSKNQSNGRDIGNDRGKRMDRGHSPTQNKRATERNGRNRYKNFPPKRERDQDESRYQRRSPQPPMRHQEESFQQFYEDSAYGPQTDYQPYLAQPPPMNYQPHMPQQPPFDYPPYPPSDFQPVPPQWPQFHDPQQLRFPGPPQNYLMKYPPDQDSQDTEKAEASFSWKKMDYKNPPPPAPRVYNQNMTSPAPGQFCKMYSPGGGTSDPFPASFAGRRVPRGRGRNRDHNRRW